jgi:hypothetical protein
VGKVGRVSAKTPYVAMVAEDSARDGLRQGSNSLAACRTISRMGVAELEVITPRTMRPLRGSIEHAAGDLVTAQPPLEVEGTRSTSPVRKRPRTTCELEKTSWCSIVIASGRGFSLISSVSSAESASGSSRKSVFAWLNGASARRRRRVTQNVEHEDTVEQRAAQA